MSRFTSVGKLALTLATMLAVEQPGCCLAAVFEPETARVAFLSDVDAWKRLPAVVSGGGQRLPSWAKALAGSLPRTTAAMLDLDRIHRTKSPLGPLLRGKMRWVAARANHCDYGMAYAAADLKRAGLNEMGFRVLKGDRANLSDSEREVLEFAQQITVDASEVTDEEVARLIARYGEEKVVAMVLLLAYANFQDRLLLTLGIPIEAGGPMPPPEVVFDRKAKPPPVPPRERPKGRPIPDGAGANRRSILAFPGVWRSAGTAHGAAVAEPGGSAFRPGRMCSACCPRRCPGRRSRFASAGAW